MKFFSFLRGKRLSMIIAGPAAHVLAILLIAGLVGLANKDSDKDDDVKRDPDDASSWPHF